MAMPNCIWWLLFEKFVTRAVESELEGILGGDGVEVGAFVYRLHSPVCNYYEGNILGKYEVST
jgi:hypothetical protein